MRSLSFSLLVLEKLCIGCYFIALPVPLLRQVSVLVFDGKRFSSDGRFIVEVGEAKGGGLEEGGVGILRGRRLADDGKRFCDGRFGS